MTMLRLDWQNRAKMNDNLRRYVEENDISLSLGGRISTFLLEYRVAEHVPVNRKDTPYKALPKNLQLMVDWEVYHKPLSMHPLFHQILNRGPGTMLQICHRSVDEVTVHTCNSVFNCGEEARGMHFMKSGVIRYTIGFDEKMNP